MIKFVFVISAFVLLVEGLPDFPADLIEAAKNDNWEQFRKLLALSTFAPSNDHNIWPPAFAGSVESLQPSDGTHVYGHSISALKVWSNDNGKILTDSKGVEIENLDGVVTKHKFKL